MKSSTGSQHVFSQIPEANIPRSVFNRSHGHKTTFDAGYLVPFYVDEALPGDTFNLNATLFPSHDILVYGCILFCCSVAFIMD